MAKRTGRKKVARKRYRVFFSRRSTHYIDVEAEDATRAGWEGEHRVRSGDRLKETKGSPVWLIDCAYELED